jgi:hypothetical protein
LVIASVWSAGDKFYVGKMEAMVAKSSGMLGVRINNSEKGGNSGALTVENQVIDKE